MNFIEEYNYNNNNNYGINTPPECPKYVMGQGWHIHLITLGGTCDNHHTLCHDQKYRSPRHLAWAYLCYCHQQVPLHKPWINGWLIPPSSTSLISIEQIPWWYSCKHHHVAYDQKIIELINLLIVDVTILIQIKMIHNFINGLHLS